MKKQLLVLCLIGNLFSLAQAADAHTADACADKRGATVTDHALASVSETPKGLSFYDTYINRWTMPRKVWGTIGMTMGVAGLIQFARKARQHHVALSKINIKLEDPNLETDERNRLLRARDFHTKWRSLHTIFAGGSTALSGLGGYWLGKNLVADYRYGHPEWILDKSVMKENNRKEIDSLTATLAQISPEDEKRVSIENALQKRKAGFDTIFKKQIEEFRRKYFDDLASLKEVSAEEASEHRAQILKDLPDNSARKSVLRGIDALMDINRQGAFEKQGFQAGMFFNPFWAPTSKK